MALQSEIDSCSPEIFASKLPLVNWWSRAPFGPGRPFSLSICSGVFQVVGCFPLCLEILQFIVTGSLEMSCLLELADLSMGSSWTKEINPQLLSLGPRLVWRLDDRKIHQSAFRSGIPSAIGAMLFFSVIHLYLRGSWRSVFLVVLCSWVFNMLHIVFIFFICSLCGCDLLFGGAKRVNHAYAPSYTVH